MKKLFSLMLLLATMLTFTACGGDDKDEPEYPSIIGTWVRQAVETSSGNTTITIDQTQTFRADMTCTSYAKVYLNGDLLQEKTFEYTYVYDGTTLKLTGKDSGKSQNFSVNISGNTLTMTGDDGTLIFTRK